MKLRAPSVPLITVDPYFSVWSSCDKLYEKDTVHWTDRPIVFIGTCEIDNVTYRFMGGEHGEKLPVLNQIALDIDAFSSTYTFEGAGIELCAKFTTPMLPTDLYYLSRPISYLKISVKSVDKKRHSIYVKISVSEQVCLNLKGEDVVECEQISLGNNIKVMKMGSLLQPVLVKDGDDLRIDFGYFYISAQNGEGSVEKIDDMTVVSMKTKVKDSALFAFAYDDVKSIEYFYNKLPSYWNKNGESIKDEIVKSFEDYSDISQKCLDFSDRMFIDATRAGGEKYAELLLLATRQTLGAHKIAVDTNGEILYVSKECFSNGCAATVDVTYPSIPFFLLYNTELIKGMLRPVIKYSKSSEWLYDFAPHDAGKYPRVNGQVYHGTELKYQMPVEECGNILITDAAVSIVDGNTDFANEHMNLLTKYVEYLIKYGKDPEDQLCTDDFAGHLAHNCNLSLKAIMGIASLGIILNMEKGSKKGNKYLKIAKDYAKDFISRAANIDGSFRLAFDREDTFSMKYNIVWDKLFGTQIMPEAAINSEVASYQRHVQPYGLPLDSRKPYTKCDWLVWTATLAKTRDEFEQFIEPLWNAYNYSTSRVPMTDWYYTQSGEHKLYGTLPKSFRNRTVVGGLFIKLLEYKKLLK